MSDIVVSMKGIDKSFSENKVLHGVELNLYKGSIHALLGENGAGKSTLMNILGGVLPPDEGTIEIGGKTLKKIADTIAAKKLGIGFVHQELTLLNDLTIFENLFIGDEIKKGPLLDKKTMIEKSKEILDRVGVDLDPKTPVRELNTSYKQVVEIARILMHDAKIIIMDEPTASLTDVEIANVFKMMSSLRDQGISIVFISHKLGEVMQICDRYTVLRNGYMVATGLIDDTINEHVIATHMVGRELSYDGLYVKRETGDMLLEVKGLEREREFKNADFSIKKGEIVGFTGLLGDGRNELFESVVGANSPYKGEIILRGQKVKMNSRNKSLKGGVSYVPRNRKENGIVKDLNIATNMTLSVVEKLKNLLLISRRKERGFTDKYIKELSMSVHNVKNPITSLSGGNQQKAVLAKALGTNPDLIIMDNPTQGVDVGAKLEIYSLIMQLAQQGVSFFVLSSEAPEVLMLCDRIFVMFEGEIRAELDRSEATEQKIMFLATGGVDESVKTAATA
ncbi:MAG: sugar ABC transporter ATP-binding protein [Oscillospiraceae bacterium]|nr:sugar ABC transporter ATP-binding protein [Oscillospiraceae bacterium]MCL2277823.1 sugar ABC transporter ATP-binding protein [Oscillospiraceae bacterium]